MKARGAVVAAFGRFANRGTEQHRAVSPIASLSVGGSVAPASRRAGRRSRLLLAASIVALLLALLVASAGASKGVLTYFGSTGTGDGQFGAFATATNVIAVNDSGAGTGAEPGDLYVIDNPGKRIEQFSKEGAFIRAFGWGVQDGSQAFQVCTSGCQAGITPTAAGAAGSIPGPRGIAVDQATGNVFVSDQTDRRVSVYGSDGTFQGAFGADVIPSGQPGDTGTGVELCTAASTCKQASASGAGAGLLGSSLGGLALDPSGRVLVADRTNRRITRYALTFNGSEEVTGAAFFNSAGWDVDPAGLADAFETCTIATTCRAGQTGGASAATSPGKFATNFPTSLAVDSAGDVYAANNNGGAARIEKLTPAGEGFAVATFFSTGSETLESIAIGPSDRVFAVKAFAAGATPACPNGSASKAERRVLELSAAGVLIDTHMACAAINTLAGLAVNQASGRLYVPSPSPESRVYALDNVPAPLATIEPVTDQTATTATFSGHVDPNGSPAGYHFEYSSDAGATWQTTNVEDIDLGTAPADVQSVRAGLQPNTEYRVRLVATKPFGAGSVTAGPVSFTTLPAPPVITAWPSVTTSETAELHARLDPQGSTVTDCSFEWGPTASYGHSVPCDPDPGAGNEGVLVSATLAGLQLNSDYHFRLLATNQAGTATGPDRQVHTGPTLPDDRAYEQVSPVDKNGADVLLASNRTRASADGDALLFASLGAFADTMGTGVTVDYLARRLPGQGWVTHSLIPNQPPQSAAEYTLANNSHYEPQLFTEDLSTGVFRAVAPPPGVAAPNVEKARNFFWRRDILDPGPGEYTILTACPVCASPLPENFSDVPTAVAASADLSHVLFESKLNLTTGPSGNQRKLYEAIDDDLTPPTVRLAGLLPGEVSAQSSTAGGGGGLSAVAAHAISADGSKVFFTVPATADPSGTEQLYMRLDGAETFRLSAPEDGLPDLTQDVTFQGASQDGSHVFFTTGEQLTDDPIGSNCDALYMYDTTASDSDPENLTLLSTDGEPSDFCGGVQGVIGSSDDGHRVYFLANGQLDPGGSPLNPGTSSIYLWHDGVVRFIASVSGSTSVDVNLGLLGAGNTSVAQRARVSADGRHLLFIASASPSLGYDHGSPCTAPFDNLGAGEGCTELYLYDADAAGGQGELTCATCRPSGSPAGGSATTQATVNTGGALNSAYASRALSDDGRFVFFTSADALAPEDTNGVPDAYQYDSLTGQVGLLSTGTDEAGSYFLAASNDGTDVFFATRSQLVGQDVDHAYDIYDARVGGGIAAQNPPPVSAPCSGGDSCRGAAPAPPGATGAASASLLGTGNPPSARRRCPKRRRAVKAKGKTRCVKRNKRKHRRTANHHRRASR